jgi:hypothetical protein
MSLRNQKPLVLASHQPLALGLLVLCALAGLFAMPLAPAWASDEYVPAGTFASEGSGNGQLVEPAGVAVNDSTEIAPGAGDVYVADKGNSRVERFSAAGAYLGSFDGSGTFEVEGKTIKGTPAPTGRLGRPALIAVDDSGKSVLEDPSVGDVYVVDAEHNVIDEFAANGEYLSQVTKGGGVRFQSINGIAVDSDGNLLVLEAAEHAVYEFSDTGSYLGRPFYVNKSTPIGLAVDSAGDVYIDGEFGRLEGFVKQAPSGKEVEIAEGGGVSAFAVDRSTNGVLVDRESFVERYGPYGEPPLNPVQRFPAESEAGLQGSHGIAVNSSTHTAYVSQSGAGDVAVFDYLLLPTVRTERASQVSETAESASGTITPEGEAITECAFEFGTETSYGQSVPCTQTAGEINAASKGGTVPVAVSAEISGLQARTAYDFRLRAADGHGAARGGSEAFYTFGRPAVEHEVVQGVGANEASVSAEVAPGGEPSSYRVQYGTSSVEEHSTPEVSAGSARAPVGVTVELNGLEAGASYHARLLASNRFGVAVGAEVSFTTNKAQVVSEAPGGSTCSNRTYSGFDTALPDCRAYELVSNPIDETYLPDYDEVGSFSSGTGELVGPSYAPVRAADTGEGLMYEGGESDSGIGGSGATSNGNGNQYLATRGSHGWTANDISIPSNAEGGAVEFTGASNDLSTLVLSASQPVEGAPGNLASCRATIYSQDASGLRPLVTMNHGSSSCGGEPADIASDEHVLFESTEAYTPEATPEQAETEVGGNLYDSVKGVVHQVNVEPDGQVENEPTATFGANLYSGRFADAGTVNQLGDSNADGSRVIWTALQGQGNEVRPKALYVRENDTQPQSPVVDGRCTDPSDACTVQLDALQAGSGTGGEGLFWASAEDGAKVFFTDCQRLTEGSTAHPGAACIHRGSNDEQPSLSGSDLYEYDFDKPVGERLSDLTVDHAPQDPLGADVQGVVGTSEDGSYVYFVAHGVLAGSNVEGIAPVAGQANLYEWHEGAMMFVTTLAPSDDEIHGAYDAFVAVGSWQFDPGMRSAEVSPSGNGVAFVSRLELTGYDNYVDHYGTYEHVPELFVYQASTGRIVCASCSPTGAPAVPLAGRVSLPGATVPTSNSGAHMAQWVADRGGMQVYFMTAQPLVASDTNGLQDVYEWRSDGSDGCAQAAGCDSLLSTAEPASNAYLIDSAVDGRDVFFTTVSALTLSGAGERLKVYDARVDGGFLEPSTACSGTGCQGAPPSLPIFATPASATFNGVGNFEPAPQSKPKSKPKAKPKKAVRCTKGKRRTPARCRRRKSAAPKKRAARSSRKGGVR